jgi:transcriptional regulator with XRE-family HTH domain
MLPMNENFGEWLKSNLKRKGLSQTELAEIIGVRPAQISRIISGERGTTPDTLEGIARAFGVPIQSVYIAAGLIPSVSEEKELINQLLHLTAQLPEQDQQDILEYARMRVQLAEKRGKYENRPKARKITSSP